MIMWLFVGLLLGSTVAGITVFLVQPSPGELYDKFIRADLENYRLCRKNAALKIELEDERYRHDRVQDFCVKLGEQLDAAKKDLRDSSACFTCGRNASCLAGPASEPDARCGSYRWRGECSYKGAQAVRDCHVAGAPRNDSVLSEGTEETMGKPPSDVCEVLRPTYKVTRNDGSHGDAAWETMVKCDYPDGTQITVKEYPVTPPVLVERCRRG